MHDYAGRKKTGQHDDDLYLQRTVCNRSETAGAFLFTGAERVRGQMDQIKITGLKVFAHHGVFEEETRNGQDFFVNAALYLDCRKAGKCDSLADSVDYGEVCHFMTQFLQNHTYRLIEAAAEHLATELLLSHGRLFFVEIELLKPNAPIGLPFENVSVSIRRGWHTVFLSVGSNMGDRERFIRDGIRRLCSIPQIRDVAVSDLIETAPYGGVCRQDFLNGAVRLETLFTPHELLECLHAAEAEAGRVRTVRWGPRTLDLDIIFYDNLVFEDADLMIPHIDMQNRMFVLEPLSQLCAYYRHPVLGKTVSELLMSLKKTEDYDEKRI